MTSACICMYKMHFLQTTSGSRARAGSQPNNRQYLPPVPAGGAYAAVASSMQGQAGHGGGANTGTGVRGTPQAQGLNPGDFVAFSEDVPAALEVDNTVPILLPQCVKAQQVSVQSSDLASRSLCHPCTLIAHSKMQGYLSVMQYAINHNRSLHLTTHQLPHSR